MDLKTLMAMGLTEEQAKAVMKSLDDSFIPKTRFDEVNEANKTAKKDLADRDKQLDELRAGSTGNAELEQKIAALQTTNNELTAQREKDRKDWKVQSIVEKVLTDAKALNVDAARALLNLKEARLSEDEKAVVGLSEQMEKLTKGEKTAFLFSAEAEKKPIAPAGFVPHQGAGTPASKGEPMNLEDAVRTALQTNT